VLVDNNTMMIAAAVVVLVVVEKANYNQENMNSDNYYDTTIQ
jgi:hypothetical protein